MVFNVSDLGVDSNEVENFAPFRVVSIPTTGIHRVRLITILQKSAVYSLKIALKIEHSAEWVGGRQGERKREREERNVEKIERQSNL